MIENTNQSSHAEMHREGPVARAIEDQTAKMPSDTFLWAAGGAVATSWILRLLGRKEASNFVGEWVPTLLILGVYNKIVKTHGHDRADSEEREDSRSKRSEPMRGGLEHVGA